jgi:hypothetical protein
LLHQQASAQPLKQQSSHKTWCMFVADCCGDDVGGCPLWLSPQRRPQSSCGPAHLGIILDRPGARADPTDERGGRTPSRAVNDNGYSRTYPSVLKRAKSEGKRLGGPPLAPALVARIREALNKPERTEGRSRPGLASIPVRFSVSAALSTAQASPRHETQTHLRRERGLYPRTGAHFLSFLFRYRSESLTLGLACPCFVIALALIGDRWCRSGRPNLR